MGRRWSGSLLVGCTRRLMTRGQPPDARSLRPRQAPPPAPGRLSRGLNFSGHGVVGLARGAGQHDLCTAGKGLYGLGTTGPLFQRVSFFGAQRQLGFWASRSHRCPSMCGDS